MLCLSQTLLVAVTQSLKTMEWLSACSVGFYYKESWAPKNWCFWTVVLEKTLESPLDRKEIQPVHPKWNQSWIFTGRTDAEAEAPKLWPPDTKNWLIIKDPDAGKDWRGKEKRGWDGWMASPTQWTWVWVNSRSWWWTGKPGMLRSVAKSQTWLSDWTDWTSIRENGKTFKSSCFCK